MNSDFDFTKLDFVTTLSRLVSRRFGRFGSSASILLSVSSRPQFRYTRRFRQDQTGPYELADFQLGCVPLGRTRAVCSSDCFIADSGVGFRRFALTRLLGQTLLTDD